MRRRPGWPWVVLGVLVVVSAFVRWLGARGVPSPWFTPDEQTYGLIGEGLWRHGRYEILGHEPQFLSLVYPLLAGLPLSMHDAERGYALLKVVQAVVMSLVAVPVYLWGRTLMARGWALVAAALSLCLPALAFTGFVMTEVAFYPIVALTAWLLARALAGPTAASQALAVGAIALAVGTRLQAIVFVPVVALAVALQLLFERRGPSALRRYVPLLAGLTALTVVWLVVQRGQALGAYGVTSHVSYGLSDAGRFFLYHLADLVLLTAFVPVLALAIVAVPSLAGRETSRDVQAFVAVAIALAAGFVAQVGLFASRLLGRLAERNLIGLAPLAFLGFALWLDRRCPRPRFVIAAAGAVAIGLLAYLPPSFISAAAEPDAFSVIPLHRLQVDSPGTDIRLVLVLLGAGAVSLVAFWPRDARWLLAVVVGGGLALASIWISDVVAKQARDFQRITVGNDRTWIDSRVDGPAVYVYGGELDWSGGAPPWQNVFWNRRIDRVYSLGGRTILGPLPTTAVTRAPDGRLVTAAGRPIRTRWVVAAGGYVAIVGRKVADATDTGLSLWEVKPPVRVK
ncbi:MAG TPA: glycosyltransferase family 39 protein [Gaiellaceae bacterium]